MACSTSITVANSSNSARSRILICGYYGEHNLGDDALLSVLLNQLQGRWIPVITARDRRAVQSMAPGVETVDRRSLISVLKEVRHVDAVILGGGSLLQDSTSTRSLIYYVLLIWRAKMLQKPVFLWAQGLGPLKRWTSRLLVERTLKTVTSASWRDPGSLQLAENWSLDIPMAIGPDPVWSHPAPDWKPGHSLILCLRPTPLLSNKGWEQLVNALSQFGEMHDFNVVWLAFHGQQDADLFTHLCEESLVPKELERRSTVVCANSIAQVQRLFSESRMVIAMRLHALILAAVGGVPTSALSYDPKVSAAAELAGLPYCELSDQLSEQLLMDQWIGAMNKPLQKEHINSLALDATRHSKILNQQLQTLFAE